MVVVRCPNPPKTVTSAEDAHQSVCPYETLRASENSKYHAGFRNVISSRDDGPVGPLTAFGSEKKVSPPGPGAT